jgi:hypothetical protein
MAKPKTTYSPVTKPRTTFGRVAKAATAFTKIAKNATAFGTVAKPATSYSPSSSNNSSGSWLLNSTIVTLNSTLYRLNGYTTTSAPNQLSTKNPVTYAEA